MLGSWYYRGELACTFIMQPPQLATLDMGVSLPIFNGLREERVKEWSYWYYRGELACTFIMQLPQPLDMGVSLPIFNGLREER